jgi:hypothetical protein
MKQGLLALKDSIAAGQVIERPDLLLSFDELLDIMGMAEVQDLEQRFLTPEQLSAKYGRAKQA